MPSGIKRKTAGAGFVAFYTVLKSLFVARAKCWVNNLNILIYCWVWKSDKNIILLITLHLSASLSRHLLSSVFNLVVAWCWSFPASHYGWLTFQGQEALWPVCACVCARWPVCVVTRVSFYPILTCFCWDVWFWLFSHWTNWNVFTSAKPATVHLLALVRRSSQHL